MADAVVREYGIGTETVIVLHGGPAAAGDVAPLARELGERWHVLEPFQRGSSAFPLTVGTHVRDLNDLIGERCGGHHPVLGGHSWGAMLALAYAAQHPTVPAGLILIGCGTFTLTARAEFERRLEARLTVRDRAYLADLRQTEASADRRMAAIGRLMKRVYAYEIEDAAEQADTIDAAAHEQTWADMKHRQEDGTYPAAFAAIGVPVLMIHGEQDPHPGRLIKEELRTYIPHLEYLELPKCGHSPGLERLARRSFFDNVNAWLEARFRKALRTG